MIADIISNSTHIVLNSNTPTRQPHIDQNPTVPDISTDSNTLANKTTWTTLTALGSDHLPILITYCTKVTIRQQTSRRSLANWEEYTREIEQALENAQPPQDVHIGKIILSADKHNIPKGKMHHKSKLLIQGVRTLIQHRNQIRSQLPELNKRIDKQIQDNKVQLWREHLEDDWDHRHNTHKLWKTISALSNKKKQKIPSVPPSNSIIKLPPVTNRKPPYSISSSPTQSNIRPIQTTGQ